jgi:hypothetical protein
MDDFFQKVRDAFEEGFDPWEMEHQSQSIATRKHLADDEYNFLEKMPEPDEYEYSQPGSSRPSTSGRRPPVSHSARGSVEHAARSTPNLALGSPQHVATHPHRLSYNNALSPPVNMGGFFGGYEAYYQSGVNSNGPATPMQVTSGQQTPSLLPGAGVAGQQQWFHSDWATHVAANSAQDAAAAALTEAEQARLQRGHEHIAASHALHQHGIDQHYARPSQSQPSSSSSAAHLAPPADHRFSGIFHSALPADMADDDERLGLGGPGSVKLSDEPRVLFVVASLFEFHIDGSRKEAGFPYLRYVAGEVFDILAQRGELWLARNQDDPERTLGWIWEKHFALLPTEET